MTGRLNGEWQEMRCAYETPSGFRAPTTIFPIRLRLLGEMVAHLAQGYAPRPHRNGEDNGNIHTSTRPHITNRSPHHEGGESLNPRPGQQCVPDDERVRPAECIEQTNPSHDGPEGRRRACKTRWTPEASAHADQRSPGEEELRKE